MKTFFKYFSAFVTGILILLVMFILLVAVDQELAFLAAALLPMLAGFLFNGDKITGWWQFGLLLSLPAMIGLGLFGYVWSTAILPVFIPFAAAGAFLGAWLRRPDVRFRSLDTAWKAGIYGIALLIAVLGIGPRLQIDVEQVDDPAPAFELTTLGGETVRSADLDEKIVVLDFWATWCGACRDLLPKMERLQKKYEDHPDVYMAAVHTGWNSTLQEAKEYIEENPKDMPLLYDRDARMTEKLDISGVPRVLIIEGDRIRVRNGGYFPSMDFVSVMSGHIDRLLEEN